MGGSRRGTGLARWLDAGRERNTGNLRKRGHRARSALPLALDVWTF